MTWIICYLAVGLVLSYVVKMENDQPALSSPGMFFLVLLLWPAIVWYMWANCERIRWNGKVIWERNPRRKS